MCPVAVHGVSERGFQLRPQRVAVHRLHHGRIEHALGDRGSIAAHLDGIFVDVNNELVEERCRVTVVVDLAGTALGAVGKERRELLLEALQLGDGLIEAVCVRIGRTIEYGRTHGVGEHRDPGGAELGAVGESEVGDGIFAECTADGVHVASRGFGGDVLEHFAVVLHTEIDEFLCEIDHPLLGGSIVGRRVDTEESVVVLRAVHRWCRFAGATWVPADDVEPVGELCTEVPLGAGCNIGTAEARSTRVHQHRADSLGRTIGEPARKKQGEGTGTRIVVIERHRQASALERARRRG